MATGIFFSTLAAMTWGLVYVLQQKALNDFPIFKLIFYQSVFMALSALLFLALSRINSERLTFADAKIVLRPSFILLLIGLFAGEFFILRSVRSAGATTATIFEITYPLFTVAFAFFILRQPIHWLTVFGGALMIAGSMLVVWANRL